MLSPTRTSLRNVEPLDVAIVSLGGALAVGTGVLVVVPELSGRLDAPLPDVAINVAATLVGGAVAILAWVRWREAGGVASLLESAAFVLLTLTNAVTLGLLLSGRGDLLDADPASAGAVPAYVWSLARLLAASLLVVGAAGGLRRARPPDRPLVVAIGPTLGLFVVGLVLAAGASGPDGPPPLDGPLLVAVQFLVFAIYLVAALLFRRLYMQDRAVSHGFLAAGLVVAAFSQLHFAMNPVVAIGIVTSGDVLRVGFYAILFLGIQAELQADLIALRRANADLRALREADAANATIAERARLAREIHDGLAQDLWSAKLKAARLTQSDALDGPSRELVGEIASAIDAGLADARQAVMALRVDQEAGSFAEILRRYVADFADRFGLRPEVQIDGAVPALSPRVEAELLRIAQEALNNVRKHADATTVWLRLISTDGGVTLTVTDNGRGFDVDRVGRGGFGLRGMHERTDIIGGRLELDSRPSDGTSISVTVPTRGSPA